MDARMDHVGYVTPRNKKKYTAPPVPFAPIINLIINCAGCVRDMIFLLEPAALPNNIALLPTTKRLLTSQFYHDTQK
jgi:hypothetical protein